MEITKAEATALNLALKKLAVYEREDRIGAILKTSGALLGDGICSLLDKLDAAHLSDDEQLDLRKNHLGLP